MKDERRRLASVLIPSPHVTTVTGGRLSDGSLQCTECIGHGGLLSGSMLGLTGGRLSDCINLDSCRGVGKIMNPWWRRA